jgi:hypothetical protein
MAVGNRAVAFLSLNDETQRGFASFKRSLGETAGLLDGFKSKLAGLLSIGAATAFLGSTIRQLDELADAAERTGRSAEELAQLQHAFRITGASAEDVGLAMRTLSLELSKAKQGSREQAELFRSLQIDVGQIENSTEALEALAGAFPKLSDLDRLRVARELLGRGGENLVPALKDGPQALRALREEAAALQPDLAAAARAANAFGDSIDRTVIAIKGGLGPVLASALPGLTEFFTQLQEGRRISGGFGAALRDFALLPAGDPGTKIRKLNEELEKTRRLLTDGQRWGFDTKGVEESVQRLERQRQFVQGIQARQALAGRTGDAVLDARDRRLRVQQGLEGGRLTLPAENTGDRQRLQEALGRLEQQRAKQVVDEERDLAQSRLRALETFYSEGLIAESDYWSRRLEVQRAAMTAELAAINQEVEARRQAVGTTKGGTAERVNAERELLEALNRRNAAERAFGQFGVENALAARRATQEYTDALRDLEGRLLSIQGKEEEALRLRQDRQNRVLRQRAESNQDIGALRTLEAVERGERAQAAFNELRQRGTEITDRLALAEERIQNSLRVGAISELEALRRTGTERERAVHQLDSMANSLEALGEASGLDRLRLQAEQFRVAVETLNAQTGLMAEKFQQIGESAGATFLEDLITGTKNAKEAFTDMVNSIVRDIGRLAAQDIAKSLFGGSSGGDFGNIIGKIFSGVVGGGGGGGSLNLSSFGPAFAADGAMTRPNQPFIVGERGPELFVPSTAGQIVPNGKFGGGVSVVNHFAITGPVDARSQEQIALAAGRSIMSAMRRSG